MHRKVHIADIKKLPLEEVTACSDVFPVLLEAFEGPHYAVAKHVL